jgi:hypothetical protein
MGEGSSENRLGLDESGVEEVRRIMCVHPGYQCELSAKHQGHRTGHI